MVYNNGQNKDILEFQMHLIDNIVFLRPGERERGGGGEERERERERERHIHRERYTYISAVVPFCSCYITICFTVFLLSTTLYIVKHFVLLKDRHPKKTL